MTEEGSKIILLVFSTFGRFDFAFNNAGTFGSMGALAEQSEEVFDQVFGLNVKALFLLLQNELALMSEPRSGGSIVNTASVNGPLRCEQARGSWPDEICRGRIR